MTEKEFLEVIEASCNHPGLYTATGSFYEVVSFLEGYGIAADVGNNSYHSALTPFLKLIVEKFKIQEVIINWKEFRELFSSDSEAFQNLPILYKEYAESI